MTERGIYVPGARRVVSIRNYCQAIRKAKANPDAMFPTSLECWWPSKGSKIVAEFRSVMNARITAGRPIRR